MLQDLLRLASEGAPPVSLVRPDTIVLGADRKCLRVTWEDGARSELSAARLRGACRCAWCTRARIDGTFAASLDDVVVVGVTPIGDYAINIGFSDGHARGIYPWAHLRALDESGELSQDPKTARAATLVPRRED
jgi:DUF971 family protein